MYIEDWYQFIEKCCRSV